MRCVVGCAIGFLLASFPVLADETACEQAGKHLRNRTQQCLSSSMPDTCIDQAIAYYGNIVLKIEGGCDDAGAQLKDCLVDALSKDRNDMGPIKVCLESHSY